MEQLIHKTVNGFKNLAITVDGQPYDLKKKQLIKVFKRHGYLAIRAKNSKNGNLNTVYLHQLVASTWLVNPKKHRFVRFINNDFKNIHARNLYYDSIPSTDAVPIPGFEQYYCDPLGKVFSTRINAFLSPSNGTKDYPMVHLFAEKGRHKWFQVHRIVGEIFNENPLNLPICHHLNHDRTDARACNLKWTDQSSNVKYAIKHGSFKQLLDGSAKGSLNSNFQGVYVTPDQQVFETQKEVSTHLKTSIHFTRKMIMSGEIRFVPKSRIAKPTELKQAVLNSLNTRRASKRKK